MDQRSVPQVCPYCRCGAAPDLLHSWWHCPAFAGSRDPDVELPSDPMELRLGWAPWSLPNRAARDFAFRRIRMLGAVRARELRLRWALQRGSAAASQPPSQPPPPSGQPALPATPGVP
eukprot:9224346-Alexandrium_andersonii.AAC.1